MSQQIINISTPDDGLGDVLRNGFDKTNQNFTELYSGKVDKIAGKGLSTNDFTDTLKTKLDGIEEGAQVNVRQDFGENDPDSPLYIPNRPPSLYASVGYFDYNDLATQTTPISLSSGIMTKLTNDAEGDLTSIDQAPYLVSSVWNTTDNQFDFSQMSVGDTIDLRVDCKATTTGTNKTLKFFLKLGIGTASEFYKLIGSSEYKTAVTDEEVVKEISFYIGSEDIKEGRGELYALLDSSGEIKVNGWYTRIIRKNLNIVEITGGGNSWGSITGTLSDQTDLQDALDNKQDTLVSGTNIKTINGTTILGSGDLVIESSNDLYKSWFSYTARNDLAGIFSVNNQALVATGTQTLVNPTGVSRILSIPLQNYAGATTAGAVAGLKQSNTADAFIRNGYDAYFIFANNDTNSNHQTIVGFTSLLPNFPNVDISAYTGDFQGVGNDVGDTNLSFYCKRITATASYVKIPLGSGFPAHTTTDVYLLRIEAPQMEVATDQFIKMTITNLITGATATHTFTYLECPALGQALCTSAQRSNRNTGASAVFRFGKVHVTRKTY